MSLPTIAPTTILVRSKYERSRFSSIGDTRVPKLIVMLLKRDDCGRAHFSAIFEESVLGVSIGGHQRVDKFRPGPYPAFEIPSTVEGSSFDTCGLTFHRSQLEWSNRFRPMEEKHGRRTGSANSLDNQHLRWGPRLPRLRAHCPLRQDD